MQCVHHICPIFAKIGKPPVPSFIKISSAVLDFLRTGGRTDESIERLQQRLCGVALPPQITCATDGCLYV